MGTCTVNSIELPDGSSCQSGVWIMNYHIHEIQLDQVGVADV